MENSNENTSEITSFITPVRENKEFLIIKADSKPLLTISPTGIIVDTDTPVDEVAKRVLEVLDLNIKKMVQDHSKDLLDTLEEILELDNLQHTKLLVKLTLKDYYNKHSEVI